MYASQMFVSAISAFHNQNNWIELKMEVDIWLKQSKKNSGARGKDKLSQAGGVLSLKYFQTLVRLGIYCRTYWKIVDKT